VVFDVAAPLFAASVVVDPTFDLWQLSDPIDLGYMQLAYRVDPFRHRLLRDWFFPYFATYSSIATDGECRLTPKLPSSLREPLARVATSGGSDPCLVARMPLPDGVVTPDLELYTEHRFRNEYLKDYEFSEPRVTYLRDAVALARTGGAEVAFVEYPTLGLEAINPAAYLLFRQRIGATARDLSVNFVTLKGEHIQDVRLWADPVHLNRSGATVLAPELADALINTVLRYTAGGSHQAQ